MNLVNPEQFDTTDPTVSGDTGEEQNLTMPLGTGDMPGSPAAADPLAGATKTGRLGGGSVVIIAVLVIAALGLFSMRKIANVTAATPIDDDVNQMIEDFVSGKAETGADGGNGRAQDEKILDGLISENYTERQVPLQDVQRNPFIIFGLPQPVLDETPAPVPQDTRELDIKRRREAMQKAASGLELKSVLGGSTPLANISGQIYRVGETITAGREQIVYRIDKITARTVDLVAEDVDYNLEVTVTLTMESIDG